jgi:dipeptidyl aminopeptidase/acylaminoacyl peptidase
MSFIRYQNLALEYTYQYHQTLEQLADPKVNLAGRSISERLNGAIMLTPRIAVTIHHLDTNTSIEVALPEEIKIRNSSISPDYKTLALAHETEAGIKLMLIDISSGKVTYIEELTVNDAIGDDGYQWLSDSRTLLIKAIPSDRDEPPKKPLVAQSPIIEENLGTVSTLRTYQNLLQNPHDEKLFEYYFTSQLTLLDIHTLETTNLGEPTIYQRIKPSPDSSYILIEKIVRPYSYRVPYFRFPKKFRIWDTEGNVVAHLPDRPLMDQVPIGGTYTGPRNFEWQPHHDAKLVWVEALDEGDPKAEVDHRDRIVRVSAPDFEKQEELLRMQHRYSSIVWSQQPDELIYYEYDRNNLWQRGWLYDLNTNEKNLILDINTRDRYNDPGNLVTTSTERGFSVFLKQDNCVFYINNTGATAEGNYPFLAKYDLESEELEKLYRSEEGHYEIIYGFVDDKRQAIAIRRESQSYPPNYYLVDRQTGARTKISDYPNPYPEIAALHKELVTYERSDGVPLSGMLYLPENYDQNKPLPLLINAYPREYTDEFTASQVGLSPNRFIRFGRSSLRYMALHGYAVLSSASIPIVGDPETVNETFIEQTLESVKAAIDYLDERGIIDRERVGIQGHSYGAFMVANILAHSDLCIAGMANSGAYNRSLTPFGFQRERRTLWEAKEHYLNISPFMFAGQIDKPLLLIHGEEDSNSGTHPMQSERMFHALKGNGATARLVMLPHEGHHYRARKSSLHVLAEMINWFDEYVKNRN